MKKTNRRDAETALEEGEKLYRSLVELAPDAVVVHRQGKIVFINPAGVKLTGAARAEELIGRSLLEFIHPDDREIVRDRMRRMLQEGKAVPLQEEKLVRLDGQELYVEAAATPITYENEPAVMVMFRDISDRKRVEAALEESEERYRTLAETARDFIFVVDREFQIRYVNRFAAGEFGRGPESVIGRTINDLFAPDVAERLTHNLEIVMETGNPLHVQNRTPFPKRELWLDSWLVPIKDKNGAVGSVFGIARDITEPKQVETALHRSEGRLRMVLDQVPAVLWTTDTDLRFTSSAGAGLAALGLEPGQVVGLSLFKYFRTEDPDFPPIAAHRRALQGESVSYELEWQGNTYETKVEPLRDAGGVVVGTLGFAHDVTRRKETEAALRGSEERYRNLFENSPIGIYRTSPDGRILMANPSLLRMLRYSSFYELSQRDLEAEGFGPTYERAQFKRRLETAGELRGLEAQWVRSDGSSLFVRENARVVRGEDGRVLYYEGTVEDITERRQVQDRLLHLNSVLRAIRSVNQLIVRERNRGQLVSLACRTLIETRGYLNAWIVLLDPNGRFLAAAEAGLGEAFVALEGSLKQGNLPVCVAEAVRQSQVVLKDSSATECRTCPRGKADTGRTGMAVRMESDGRIYGALVVSIPRGVSADSEEQSLFEEVAGDIAYALRALELDAERNQAGRALEESEEKYRNLVERANDGIVIIQDSIVKYANPQMAEMNGSSVEQLIGTPLTDHIHPDEIPRLLDRYQRRMAGEELPTTYEAVLRRRDGSKVFAELNAGIITYQGRPADLIIVRDISERRRVALALQQSEESFRALAENANDGILIALPDGRYVYANEQAAGITGYPAAELLKLGVRDLAHPDETAKLTRNIERRLKREPVPEHYETAFRRADSSRVEIELSGARTAWQGEPAVLWIVRDITERKQAEDNVRRLARDLGTLNDFALALAAAAPELDLYQFIGNYLQKMTESPIVGVSEYDPARHELRVRHLVTGSAREAAAQPQLLTRVNEVLGSNLADFRTLVSPEALQLILATVVRATDDLSEAALGAIPKPAARAIQELLGIVTLSGLAFVYEGELVGTAVIAHGEGQPVPDTDLLRAVAHIAAVSLRRKRADEEVRRYRDHLEELVKERTAELTRSNQELESFSYSISHDLRAPLRAIDGFSRILADEHQAQLAPEARRMLQLVRGNTQQMGRLIDDLLAFSRLSRQALNRQSVDPNELVRQAIRDLASQQEGRQVEVKVGPLPLCAGDPALLKQVWINLLANALKFTRSRPKAQIEIGSRPGELTHPGDEPAYFVKDNGVGFDMTYADKLFVVFQRLHRPEEYEGTGVGLAIVKRIVERHGGRVWAEAEKDKGAIFYFTLPDRQAGRPPGLGAMP